MGWFDFLSLKCSNWLLYPQFLSLSYPWIVFKAGLSFIFSSEKSSSSSPPSTSSCKNPGVGAVGFALSPITILDIYRRRWLFQWMGLDNITCKVNNLLVWPNSIPNARIPFWNRFCCCCSVTQWCLTLCNTMDCSTPGFPVPHHLPEFAPKFMSTESVMHSKPSHPLQPSSPFAFKKSARWKRLWCWEGLKTKGSAEFGITEPRDVKSEKSKSFLGIFFIVRQYWNWFFPKFPWVSGSDLNDIQGGRVALWETSRAQGHAGP